MYVEIAIIGVCITLPGTDICRPHFRLQSSRVICFRILYYTFLGLYYTINGNFCNRTLQNHLFIEMHVFVFQCYTCKTGSALLATLVSEYFSNIRLKSAQQSVLLHSISYAQFSSLIEGKNFAFCLTSLLVSLRILQDCLTS